MNKEVTPGSRFPDPTDVELGVDADLNNEWEHSGSDYPTPAERISIREALLAQTRAEDASDRLPQSDS